LKKTDFSAEEYTVRISREAWKLNFSERKPHLKKVLEKPFAWQKFIKEKTPNQGT